MNRIFISAILSLAVFSACRGLEITGFTSNGERIGQYQKFEIEFELDQDFDNPFDPDEVDIEAVFTGPDGEIRRISGFYTVDYQPKIRIVQYQKRGGEIIDVGLRDYHPLSDGSWKIRFTPVTEGEYSYYISVKSDKGDFRYPEGGVLNFSCVVSDEPGFAERDPYNHRYLRFQNGDPFFGIGFNNVNTMGAGMEGKVRSFDFMRKMAAENGSMSQIDLCQGDYLEWTFERENRRFPYYRDYDGLGRYNMKVASQIDSAIATAEELGVYLRFSFYHWADFGNEPADGAPGFVKNPYYQGNGGPCRRATQFFTDKDAWKYQKQLFRYIVARWGYSDNILWWELWNEVDNVPDFRGRQYAVWHNKVTEYLREIDSNHMVSTSFYNSFTGAEVFQEIEADVSTYHCYVSYSSDIPFDIMNNIIRETSYLDYLGKPIVAGEFGYEARAGFGKLIDMQTDSEGIDIHNQMWASLMVGLAATAMPWGWESHIDRYDLYHHCRGISAFIAGEDFRDIKSTGERKVSLKSGKKTMRFPVIESPTREAKMRGQRTRGYHEKRTVDEARALGLISENRSFVWVYDQGNSRVLYNPSDVIEGAQLTVKGMRDGEVKIEYWDTYTGAVFSQGRGSVEKGKLIVELPVFSRDIAMKIYHFEGE